MIWEKEYTNTNSLILPTASHSFNLQFILSIYSVFWGHWFFLLVSDKLERLFFPLKNVLFLGHSLNFCEWLQTGQCLVYLPYANPSSIWWGPAFLPVSPPLNNYSASSHNTFRVFFVFFFSIMVPFWIWRPKYIINRYGLVSPRISDILNRTSLLVSVMAELCPLKIHVLKS